MPRIALLTIVFSLFFMESWSQYKSFKLSADGDTLNIVDKKGMKQGKWVTTVGELRGEPGYDEEGIYKNDKKEGIWRKYTATGDIIAIENYRYGGKDGVQKYFTFLGELQREEQWHSYNPDQPYDTIPVYGQESNQVLSYKIVKAEQYSVPDGEWKYYDPTSGSITKVEHYDRGHLQTNDESKATTATGSNGAPANASDSTKPAAPKVQAKPQEVLEYEKKYSKKKRKEMERTGETGL